MNGEASFKQDVNEGKSIMKLADRIESDSILESDIFEINQKLKSKVWNKKKFKFIKIN